MAVSENYLQYILERLSCIGAITAKRMFGAVGLYYDSKFFALIDDNTLYFKVDKSNVTDYNDAGMEPFKPFGDKSSAMKYYTLPEHVLEDDQLLSQWAHKSIAVAQISKKQK